MSHFFQGQDTGANFGGLTRHTNGPVVVDGRHD